MPQIETGVKNMDTLFDFPNPSRNDKLLGLNRNIQYTMVDGYFGLTVQLGHLCYDRHQGVNGYDGVGDFKAGFSVPM